MRVANEFHDSFEKIFVAGVIAGVAAPLAIESGLFSVAINASSFVNAGANATAQMITNKGSLLERAKDVNITSVIAAGVFKNPFGGEIVASGFKFSINEKFDRSFLLGSDKTRMSTKEFALNVGIVGALGSYGEIGLKNSTIEGFKELKNARYFLNRAGIGIMNGSVRFSVGTLTNVSGNVITDNLNSN